MNVENKNNGGNEMKAQFRTERYEMSHGKMPKGRGSWAFEISGTRDVFFASHNLTLAEAKKQAEKHFGPVVIYVAP